jgi:hypothetical protein
MNSLFENIIKELFKNSKVAISVCYMTGWVIIGLHKGHVYYQVCYDGLIVVCYPFSSSNSFDSNDPAVIRTSLDDPNSLDKIKKSALNWFNNQGE